MNYFKLFYLLLFLSYSSLVCAQNKAVEKDSTGIYNKIEDFSKKRKFTKMLHKLLFQSTTKNKRDLKHKPKERNYKPLEGKIIRNITIETLDPFGNSVTDTLKTTKNWLERTGNKVHIKSRKHTINNLLLFKQNAPLDTLLMNESERLIRSQNYVRSVQITPQLTEKDADSVDISIKVLDSWSLIPKGDFSTSKSKLRLKERNFLGFGHELNVGYTNRFSDGESAYETSYNVPNFKNTYINTIIGYQKNLDKSSSKFLNVERVFYSPYTKWAGGLYLDEQFRRDSLPDAQMQLSSQNFKYYTQDLWGGHSFRLFKGNTVRERTTNVISAARLFHIDYKERPSIAYDSIGFYSNETLILGSIGVASRQFVSDRYIFRDGIIEDVPVGTVYALTAGNQRKNQQDRLYLGAKASFGNYFNWGYFGASAEFGSFYKSLKADQTAYSFQLNYFTNLVALGEKWKLRQFIKPQFLIGTNRLDTNADRLSIDERNVNSGISSFNTAGIQGFNSELIGTKKIVLSLQSQFYSPWTVLGFRLNPFVNITSAIIGDEDINVNNSKLYSAFGLGFIIRNDYLVFNRFQLSFSFYPEIPGQGNNIFKTNSFETADFGFQNFALGKPNVIGYN